MKQLIIFLLLVPLVSAAQNMPRFEHDTLYTSGGYKIYPGQTLQFGKGSGRDGKFQYVSTKNGVSMRSLENNAIVVKELENFSIPSPGNAYIGLTGNITFKDGSKGYINIHMVFDHAIGNSADVPGELIVPDEFRGTEKMGVTLYMPHFEKDTLYTSCGYKIYKGQVLHFGKVTGDRGRFRYVNIKNHVPPLMLQNNSVLVKDLREFGISVLGNGYITITGTLLVNNNERGDIELHMAFDHAIENLPGVPSELLVPDEFRIKQKILASVEIERLNKLYQNGTISKEEFEGQKKKLQEQ